MSKLFKTKNNLRKIIFLLSILNVSIVLIFNNAIDMLYGMIIGTVLFYELVIQGINHITDRKDKVTNLYGSNYFVAFGFIMILLYSADYLFRKNVSTNVISHVDGWGLIIIYFMYTYMHIKINGIKKIVEEIREILEEKIVLKILSLIIIEIVLLSLSFGVVAIANVISLKCGLFPYITGIIILGIVTNIVNIIFRKSIETNEESQLIANREVTFLLIFCIGVVAILRKISIDIEQIYDLIICSIISVILVFQNKIDNSIAGCTMITVYLGYLLYLIFR